MCEECDRVTNEGKEKAREYVRNGAALLDEKGPENWRQTLQERRDALNVYSISYCPLGLLYGDYFTGRSVLWPKRTDYDSGEFSDIIARHGFDYGLEATDVELTNAWLDYLEPALYAE